LTNRKVEGVCSAATSLSQCTMKVGFYFHCTLAYDSSC